MKVLLLRVLACQLPGRVSACAVVARSAGVGSVLHAAKHSSGNKR
ncbi:hypothetical protein [Vogesella indigofera]|nr:hypothetical protein [Vogesella indigofera]MDC7696194.1 hypothetical protein [Vogesella indigofera]